MPDRKFPFRTLIEPAYEHSMMRRYLEKEVHDSRPVDDMETDRGWRLIEGRAELAYTRETARTGTRSLRWRMAMKDWEHLRATSKDGSLTQQHGGNVAAVLQFAEPQDWTPYNRLSMWVYVHPATMHSYSFNIAFQCEGYRPGPTAPLAVHFIQDLEPGRWNRVVWEIPDLPRDRVVSFTIANLLRGNGAEEGGVVTYNIDRIDLERVDAEKYEGWEVAPGRIAFHHAGYRPTDPKVALATGAGAEEFELAEAASGRTAARFPVRPLTTPKGRFEELDFSSFAQPGRYFLRCGGAASGAFDITEDLWCGTIEKVLNFYYAMRCGFPVPGVHGECHQDLRGRRGDALKVINGGWHDAGDLSQGSHRTGASLYGMVRTYEELCRRDSHPGLRERLLEEICWGLDWLLKTRFGDGYRITWFCAHVYTDNVVGTADDTIADARHTAFENFLFCAVAAHAARLLAEVEPERASAALDAAAEDYRATLKRCEDWSDASRDEAAFGAMAAVQLYRTTGLASYAADAAAFGRHLIECQEQSFVDGIPVVGYYYTDTSRGGIVHDLHLSFEGAPGVALEALCEALPDHEDWMDWYGAALLHSQYFLAQGATVSAPFCMLPNSVWPRAEIEALAERCKEQGRDPEPLLRQYRGRHASRQGPPPAHLPRLEGQPFPRQHGLPHGRHARPQRRRPPPQQPAVAGTGRPSAPVGPRHEPVLAEPHVRRGLRLPAALRLLPARPDRRAARRHGQPRGRRALVAGHERFHLQGNMGGAGLPLPLEPGLQRLSGARRGHGGGGGHLHPSAHGCRDAGLRRVQAQPAARQLHRHLRQPDA